MTFFRSESPPLNVQKLI